MSLRRLVEPGYQRSGYREIDSQELVRIIQYDPESLNSHLFHLSEVEKFPAPRAKRKDTGLSRRVREILRRKHQILEDTFKSARLDSDDKRMYSLL